MDYSIRAQRPNTPGAAVIFSNRSQRLFNEGQYCTHNVYENAERQNSPVEDYLTQVWHWPVLRESRDVPEAVFLRLRENIPDEWGSVAIEAYEPNEVPEEDEDTPLQHLTFNYSPFYLLWIMFIKMYKRQIDTLNRGGTLFKGEQRSIRCNVVYTERKRRTVREHHERKRLSFSFIQHIDKYLPPFILFKRYFFEIFDSLSIIINSAYRGDYLYDTAADNGTNWKGAPIQFVKMELSAKSVRVGFVPYGNLFQEAIEYFGLCYPESWRKVYAALDYHNLSPVVLPTETQCLYLAIWLIYEYAKKNPNSNAQDADTARETFKAKKVGKKAQKQRKNGTYRIKHRLAQMIWDETRPHTNSDRESTKMTEAFIKDVINAPNSGNIKYFLRTFWANNAAFKEKQPKNATPKLPSLILISIGAWKSEDRLKEGEVKIERLGPIYPGAKYQAGILQFGSHVCALLPNRDANNPKFQIAQNWLNKGDFIRQYSPSSIEEIHKIKQHTEVYAYDIETFFDASVGTKALHVDLTAEEGKAACSHATTTEGLIVPYSFQWTDDEETARVEIGPDCIWNFFYWLRAECLKNITDTNLSEEEKVKVMVFYAHNGAKFDAKIVFSWCLTNLPTFNEYYNWKHGYFSLSLDHLLLRNGKMLKLSLAFKYWSSKIIINFHDSLQYALGDLRGLAKAYNLTAQKDELVYEHITGWEDVNENETQIREYSSMDVKVLYELIQKNVRLPYDEEFIQFPIEYSASVSSLVRKILFSRFWNKDMAKIYRPPIFESQQMRPLIYRGGMVQTGFQGCYTVAPEPTAEEQASWNDGGYEAWRVRWFTKATIEDRDVTSEYPTAMCYYSMPGGRPRHMRLDPNAQHLKLCFNYEPRDFYQALDEIAPFFFIEVWYTHTWEAILNESIPPFFWLNSEKAGKHHPYIERTGEMQKTWADRNELEFIYERGGLGMYILLGANYIEFESIKPFTEYVNHFFKKKQEAEQNAKDYPEYKARYMAEKALYKNMLNHAYGGFVMNPEATSITSFSAQRDTGEELAQAVTSYARASQLEKIGENKYIMRYKTLMKNSNTSVYVGAAITSAGRLQYYDLRYQAKKQGCHFAVGDTDSGYFLVPPSVDFERDVVGQNELWKKHTGLGGLTSDYEGQKIISIAVVAPKVYGVRTVNLKDGTVNSTIKFKGMAQSDRFLEKKLDDYIITGNKTLSPAITFKGHFSQEWFRNEQKDSCTLNWLEFKAFAEGKYDFIVVYRNQLVMGISQTMQINNKHKGMQRKMFMKRYGRQLNKGILIKREWPPEFQHKFAHMYNKVRPLRHIIRRNDKKRPLQ